MKLKNILSIPLAFMIGYFASQYIHTPQRAWNIDANRDGIEDVVVEARDGKRAIMYGISESKDKDLVSGEEANKFFNPIWERKYKENFGEEPDHEKFHLETKWSHW
jgi:hypothetical protein